MITVGHQGAILGREGCLGTKENLFMENDLWPHSLFFDIANSRVFLSENRTLDPETRDIGFEVLVHKALFLDQLQPVQFSLFRKKASSSSWAPHFSFTKYT